jgi:riboflavin-specific deaminase-like protein
VVILIGRARWYNRRPREGAAVLRLFPPPAESVSPETVYDTLDWPMPGAARPYVAVNVVSTADGKAAVAGRAWGIGSATDHLLFRKLRCQADAVLVGVGTLRAENYLPVLPEPFAALREARGLARQPLAVLVCGSGELPVERAYFHRDEVRRLLLTSEAGAARIPPELAGRLEVRVAGPDRVDLPSALRLLRADYAVRWLLCEGGPRLNHGLLAANLVDELFLTLAPKLVGSSGPTVVEGPPFPPEAPVPLDLLAVHAEGAELYLRYRVPGQGRTDED